MGSLSHGPKRFRASLYTSSSALAMLPTALRPAIYDEALADENLLVETEKAYGIVKRAAREEGLLLSPSAGAALLGSLVVATRVPKDEEAVIVTVFADSVAKYLNERFWEES